MDNCRRRLLMLFVAGLMSTGAALPAPSVSAASGTRAEAAHRSSHARLVRRCAHAGTPVNTISKVVMRAAVVCLINQQRAAHHLPSLHVSPALNRSAQGWTNEMVAAGDFSHGSDFAARISAAGFRWSAAAETIATGFHTPRAVVRAWMASLGHCHSILSPTYADVGTGVSGSPLQYGFGIWTQDFGLLAGHPAPSGNFGPADGCPYQI